MANENDGQDILNLEENQNSENTEGESDELKKAQELANNYKIRAEKAEALAKQLKTQPAKKEESETPKTSDTMSLKDIRALQDVHDDDVDTITDYAKFKGISIADAKKLPEMTSLLRTREEERRTAAATFTGSTGKAPSKVTDESLISKANSSDIPDDDASIARLMEVQQKRVQKEGLAVSLPKQAQ